jgi:uncharacterized protein YjbJ (UPF0337 family)
LKELNTAPGQGERTSKLPDDDLEVIADRRDQLDGKIQERYGSSKDQVRRYVDES